MPKKGYKKKKVIVKTYVPRPRIMKAVFGSAGGSLGVPNDPFPRELKLKTRYAYVGSLNTGTGNIAVGDTFRTNSILAPKSAGQTIIGHANLAQLYGRYQVTGCKVKLTFVNTASDGLMVGYRKRINGLDTIVGESLVQAIQKPMTKYKTMSNTGEQVRVFKFACNPWSLSGQSKSDYLKDDTANSAVMSASPTSVDLSNFDVWALDQHASDSNVRYLIEIFQDVRLWERINLVPT